MFALTYQLFAVLCGWLEASLYARRGAESFSLNEHVGMTWQRIAAGLAAGAAVLDCHWFGPWLLLAEVVPLALLFPLCHDEAYNFTRLWLTWAAFHQQQAVLAVAAGTPVPADLDRRAWGDAWAQYRYGYQSPTTTARNDFDGRVRTWLAVAGTGLLVSGYGWWWWL